jgi:ubiquinone biosynthesis protein UbiJ
MKVNEKKIFEEAIRVFGGAAQEEVAIEECSELIQAITHKHRGREHNIAEEIADVEIVLEQLKIINGCHSEVKEIRKAKVKRLEDKVDECLDKCF